MKPGDTQHLFPRAGSELSAKDKLLESIPESQRGDTVPASDGHQAPVCADEEFDAEGRSQVERLVNDGVERAAREQVEQAAHAPIGLSRNRDS